MKLSQKDITEFYSDLKQGSFYLETKTDIGNSYKSHIQGYTSSVQNNEKKLEMAILHAINFEYYDSIDLIMACMPARIYIVLAIANFLMSMGCSATILKDEIRTDLCDILLHSRICEYKEYFSTTDYTAMVQDEKEVLMWFGESVGSHGDNSHSC